MELLLRAPYRGAVRLLDAPLTRIHAAPQTLIWDTVRQLQLQMHGYALVGMGEEAGGAGINAAPPGASVDADAANAAPPGAIALV